MFMQKSYEQIVQNQENLLYFIKEVIANMEQESFSILKVNLCSQFYTLFPNHVVVGHMIIIANDKYFDGEKEYLEQENVTDYFCAMQLERTREKGGKALLLKYSTSIVSCGMKFKRNKFLNVESVDYFNVAEFPYISDAMEVLYANLENGLITKEVVEKTLQELKDNAYYNKDTTVKKRVLKRKVANMLNNNIL